MVGTLSANVSITGLLLIAFLITRVIGSGRVLHSVVHDPNKYWATLTDAWHQHVRAQSEIVYRQWRKAVESANLGAVVNTRCLDVLEYMIQHPIDQQWSAKCELFLHFL